MDHSASQDLYPARMLTDAASDASADTAVNIHLGTGLREREIRRPESDLHVLSEHLLYKKVEGLLEIREGDVLVHIQPFRLMKKTVCAGADGLIPVYPPRADDPDRGPLTLHRPCLYAARVGAKKPIGILMDIERILHVPGRVILGQV